MGLPEFGIETPAAVRIVQDLAPEEGVGELRAVAFDDLEPGVYYVNDPNLDLEGMPNELATFFEEYQFRVDEAEERGALPNVTALMYISDWQADLKKIVLRMEWTDPKTGDPKLYEHEFFLHTDRRRGE
jgi:hypothetical protein